MGRFPESYTDPKITATKQRCGENSLLSSFPAANVVSTGGTPAPQRQKFHTDDVNQCLHSKSCSHGSECKFFRSIMVKFCVLLRTSSGKSQMLLRKIYTRNN